MKKSNVYNLRDAVCLFSSHNNEVCQPIRQGWQTVIVGRTQPASWFCKLSFVGTQSYTPLLFIIGSWFPPYCCTNIVKYKLNYNIMSWILAVETMWALEVKNIYSLAFYRKSLLTPALWVCRDKYRQYAAEASIVKITYIWVCICANCFLKHLGICA